jgi:DEAD/DEAH box helicase domain-containing protein
MTPMSLAARRLGVDGPSARRTALTANTALTAGTALSAGTAACAAFESVLADLVADGRVRHVERLPAREERTAGTERPLPPEVAARLPGPLWTHQAEAIDRLRRGESVVVATGTASGKSLCYQVPIAEAVADRIRPGTALVLGPTKALAQDQLRALTDACYPDVVAATYDGDCTPDERTWVRGHANVVFTNPEMLHAGLLPNHRRWSRLLMRLRYVVVDELHVMRGVFGTHVAHVLRRLRRVCELYGTSPTFVFSSATIGDPDRLARALCGLPVTAITDDGSPRGPRVVALLNPPLFDEGGGMRTSANSETAAVTARLVETGHRTIAFCRSRKGTELVAADVRRRLPVGDADLVRPYRAGYLASERREIEAELFGGRLRGVVATSALELGVDIGGLDACVLNGFPGTVASFWQQVGRAGRDRRSSVAVLVAGDDQLDQWLLAHPVEVFRRPTEPAVVNLSNPFVLHPHLACAAFERPLSYSDERYWPELLDDGVRELVLSDALQVRPGPRDDAPRAVWAGPGVPAPRVGLRTGGAGEVRIKLDDGTLVGTVDESRAHSLVHPGAVYLHQGRSYLVVDLDLGARVATVESTDGDEYTQPSSDTTIRVLHEDTHRVVGRVRLSLGAVEVCTQVTGYQRKDTRSRRILANESLELPPTRFVTRAFWYAVPGAVLDAAGVDISRAPGALHAMEHAAIGMLPLFTICDRWDVGGVSIAWHDDVGAAAVFVHDGYPGGAGIAELGFEAADRHLAATLDVIEGCPCLEGCPSCVQSPKCGNGNEPLDKAGAIALLHAILDGDVVDLTAHAASPPSTAA